MGDQARKRGTRKNCGERGETKNSNELQGKGKTGMGNISVGEVKAQRQAKEGETEDLQNAGNDEQDTET